VTRLKTELDATGGVILRRDVIARGMNDRAIRDMVSSGQWHRVRHGAYADRQTWEGLDALDQHRVLARSVLRAAGSPAVLSHVTAAVEHGAEVWDLDLSRVHVTRPDGKAGRREAGVVQHRGRLADDEVLVADGVPTVSAARAIVEVTTMAGVEHGLVVANSLVRDRPDVLDEARSLATGMDQWQNTLATRIVLGLADPRVESVAESRAQHMFWSQGLPKPEPQYEILDPQGRVVARVDFALPDLGAFYEIDGGVKYFQRRDGKSMEQVLFEERQREKLICRLTGWICIRITWADLARPQRLAREIRALLAARRTPAS
jgi:hypothetical protein